MARGFLYVYERIYKGETEMQTEFRKIPVNGKRTSVADQKRVRKVISDNAHRIAAGMLSAGELSKNEN